MQLGCEATRPILVTTETVTDDGLLSDVVRSPWSGTAEPQNPFTERWKAMDRLELCMRGPALARLKSGLTGTNLSGCRDSASPHDHLNKAHPIEHMANLALGDANSPRERFLSHPELRGPAFLRLTGISPATCGTVNPNDE